MTYANIAEAGMMAKELQLRLNAVSAGTYAVVQSFGSASDPLLNVWVAGTGAFAAGAQNALIRLTFRPSLFTNAVGNTQTVYAPQLAQILVEQLSGNTGTLVLQLAQLVPIFGTFLKYGNECQFYAGPNGTAIAEAGFATATLSATFTLDFKYGNLAAI
jgi:hypothetical protein